MKMKDVIIKEGWMNDNKTLTKGEKKLFLEKVGSYNKYGKALYSEHNLVEVAKELAEIARYAEVITLQEAGEEFDGITMQRNMKELKGLSENFAKTAVDAQSLRERLSSLYEDMGHVLQRYYEIHDEDIDENAIQLAEEKRKFGDTPSLPNPNIKKMDTPNFPKGGLPVKNDTKGKTGSIKKMDTANPPHLNIKKMDTSNLPKGGLSVKTETPKLR